MLAGILQKFLKVGRRRLRPSSDCEHAGAEEVRSQAHSQIRSTEQGPDVRVKIREPELLRQIAEMQWR